jgi:hypothetical protein
MVPARPPPTMRILLAIPLPPCYRGTVRQALTLTDIEHDVLPHHRDDASCRFVVRFPVADLELLHEIDLGAVLAFADVPPSSDACLNVR